MGCQVVSVYNDEIIGKVSLPQDILLDLIDRDYRQIKPLSQLQQPQKINHLYGFTQSFTTSRLFVTMVNSIQYLVYAAGRFIVMDSTKDSGQQYVINNKDHVTALDVKEKLCLVGLVGGVLVLWDLEFREVKLQILLALLTTAVSTVSLTNKYIFATDSKTPHNLAYCYDLRTAKMVASNTITSMEPAIKGINIGENVHITVCADGLWMMRITKKDQQLEITKMMFDKYPKTSMLCVQRIGKEYLISGGVDGYVYIWKIDKNKCVRTFKITDSQVVSLAVKNNYVIIGTMNSRIKVYTFNVTKKQKKKNISQQFQNDSQDEDLAFITVDSYTKQGSTITIALSMTDPLLYYCQTRQGMLYQKLLPEQSNGASKKQLEVRQNLKENISRFNTTGEIVMHGKKIYSTYFGLSKSIFIDVYNYDLENLILEEERIALIKQSGKNFITYSVQTQEVIFMGPSGKVIVTCTFNKSGEVIQSNENKSDYDNNSKEICQIQHQEIVSFHLVQHLEQQVLCITTNRKVLLYHRIAKLAYEQLLKVKYHKQIPNPLKLQNSELFFNKQSNKWYSKQEQVVSSKEKEYYDLIHVGKFNSIEQKWIKAKISFGGGYLIVWK